MQAIKPVNNDTIRLFSILSDLLPCFHTFFIASLYFVLHGQYILHTYSQYSEPPGVSALVMHLIISMDLY